MTVTLLDKALNKAAQGNRNETGLWLACQLRDSGSTEVEAEVVMLNYASQVSGNGTEPYTRAESIATLKSAYSKPPRAKGIRKDTTIGQGCYSVTPPKKQGNIATKTNQTTVTPPALQSVTPVTVSTLAEAKRLPVDFLKSLGIGDLKYKGQAAARIPYYGENGQELAVRYRLSLTGDNRFKWRKRDRAMPYGLNRLETIKKAGWVLIVEGESDYWTCLLYDIPALAAPGKGIWPMSWGNT
ncbi:hypothetical protein ACFLX3_05450 [Chloroflexota bacterium]